MTYPRASFYGVRVTQADQQYTVTHEMFPTITVRHSDLNTALQLFDQEADHLLTQQLAHNLAQIQ